jgi:cell division protein FtsL
MRIVRYLLAASLAVVFLAPMASAQDHAIGQSALDKAVQQRVTREQTDRDDILSLLRRPEVREIAAKAGLSLDKAQTAVSTLQGDDLQQAAAQARQVQDDLAGGSTIVISTTTIIIVLLLVILLVVVAK